MRRLGTGILLGPAAGMLIWGTGIELIAKTLTGDSIFYGGSSVPSDRIMQEVGYIIKTTTNDDDAIEKIDKVAERYNRAYKVFKEVTK